MIKNANGSQSPMQKHKFNSNLGISSEGVTKQDTLPNLTAKKSIVKNPERNQQNNSDGFYLTAVPQTSDVISPVPRTVSKPQRITLTLDNLQPMAATTSGSNRFIRQVKTWENQDKIKAERQNELEYLQTRLEKDEKSREKRFKDQEKERIKKNKALNMSFLSHRNHIEEQKREETQKACEDYKTQLN